MHSTVFKNPAVWAADDAGRLGAWCLHPTEELLRELPAAVAGAGRRGANAATLTRADFPLPSFGPLAREIRAQVCEGRGFVVLRGLPLGEFSDEELRVLYAGLSLHLGTILPQTVRGDTIYSVRDEGYKIQSDYGKPGVRTSKTNAAFSFHTDSPSRLAGHTPEFIGLLVLRTARAGGESLLVSGYTVHNILQAERPDLLSRLYQPFWVDRRAELPPGEEPAVPVPVFAFDGRLTVRYLRFYITKGQEWKGEPLTSQAIEALDFLDEAMARPGVAMMVRAEPGDLQLVNNRFLLHSRTAYEDYVEPERKRHYLRIWLA